MLWKAPILIVEDSDGRYQRFAAWFPPYVTVTRANGAGTALGILKRSANQFCGILLDHDLGEHAITDSDRKMSGLDVAKAIVETHRLKRPDILIHSMNAQQAPVMAKYLMDQGFEVTRQPTDLITAAYLRAWLKSIHEDFAE